MLLAKWLEENGRNYLWLASRMVRLGHRNASAEKAKKWANGEGLPKIREAASIAHITCGEVCASDLVRAHKTWMDRPRRPYRTTPEAARRKGRKRKNAAM